MLSHTLHHRPGGSTLAAWLSAGFFAGIIGVLVFHQPALALLHALGITPGTAYAAKATSPFGLPQYASLAFWGGLWGILAAALFRDLTGARLVGTMVVFGAIAPTLVAWFIVAPLKGLPVAGGFKAAALATGLIVNAAWGLGAGLVLAWARERYIAPRFT